MAIDREKYRRMFIEEARESLRSFNNDLVSLEKRFAEGAATPSPDAAARTREVMDAAFRTAHSLKGMAAAMSYGRFAELAHRLEDLADVARQGRSIGTEGFDLLLAGSDALEDMVEQVANGAEDPQAGDLPARIQAAVERLRTVPATDAAVAAGSAPVAAPAGLVAVKVRIAADASLPQVRAFVVHKALSALPGWKETEPPPESLRTRELPDRTLTLRFEQTAARLDEITARAKEQQGVAEVTVVHEEAPGRAEEVPAPSSGERSHPEDERTIRVRTAILDEFIDSVGELLLARSRMRALAGRLDLPELGDLVDEVDRLTRDLHGRVVAARMTPLGFLAERFPRVVRDLARSAQRTVDFTMEGTQIELDRAILDELQAPLLHMMRNAVDHAHEGDDARRAAGKPAALSLSLRASRERDTVLLELEDDGRGMDPERLRRRAVERGLISAEAARTLTDPQALELICLPGFSTAEQVSQTSGRGVGMDVVKATLERLGGNLRLHSTPGKGSRVVLQLPLTVAIIQVLVVEAGEPGAAAGARDVYAIPVAKVEQAADLDASAVSLSLGRAWMKHGDILLPLYDLSQELGYPVTGTMRPGTVVVVGRGRDVAALRVDAILGQEEVVAKPLNAPLSTFGYLAGAALLADGRAAFILEPSRLVTQATSGSSSSPSLPPSLPPTSSTESSTASS